MRARTKAFFATSQPVVEATAWRFRSTVLGPKGTAAYASLMKNPVVVLGEDAGLAERPGNCDAHAVSGQVRQLVPSHSATEAKRA
ncbi:hypothetical protein GCM10010217_43280 [Streptomyces tubercidicus]